MVTDIGQDYLDDGKQRRASVRSPSPRREPLPRLCDDCKSVVSRGVNQCPGCGATIFTKTDVLTADGRLVELGARQSGKREPTITEKAVFFYAELRGYAEARGYAQGWIAHKYRNRFGVWPNDPRITSSPPISPSLSTRNWTISRAIAFAKRAG
jgi:DNA repair protein RadD